jgi:hypothetical protein
MPRFYFHLNTAAGRETDEIGCLCESVEAAYLEAVKAAPEIAADSLRRGQSPGGFSFEVCDEAQQPVLELPFSEIFGTRPRRPPPSTDVVLSRLEASIQRHRDARESFSATVAETRQSLAVTRALLKG